MEYQPRKMLGGKLKIVNAVIKLDAAPITVGAIILSEKEIMFSGCNISGGIIDSYHHPHFIRCFLRNTSAELSSPGEKDGPIFNACRLDNIKIPRESGFTECEGDIPQNVR